MKTCFQNNQKPKSRLERKIKNFKRHDMNYKYLYTDSIRTTNTNHLSVKLFISILYLGKVGVSGAFTPIFCNLIVSCGLFLGLEN